MYRIPRFPVLAACTLVIVSCIDGSVPLENEKQKKHLDDLADMAIEVVKQTTVYEVIGSPPIDRDKYGTVRYKKFKGDTLRRFDGAGFVETKADWAKATIMLDAETETGGKDVTMFWVTLLYSGTKWSVTEMDVSLGGSHSVY